MASSPTPGGSSLGSIVIRHKEAILKEWLREMSAATRRNDLLKESGLQAECAQFLDMLATALGAGGANVTSAAYDSIREMLRQTSESRSQLGFTARETAMFVFSIKRPIFSAIREELSRDPGGLADETWNATELVDSLGLYVTDSYLKSREEMIRRQQEEMLELSTPVVKLWEGIVALPLIGTLDSARTQVVMESLLEAIVRTNSKVAIIDITGVPTVDTVVAQHLLKTVTAARLMGAECIISGVRPQIAQTIVHLGINLLDVTTKATLLDALALALRRLGFSVARGERKPSKVED